MSSIPDTPRLTPLAVMALGLLRERDMHPYEMMRLLRQRRDDRLVAVTNGTFYHTVGKLLEAGLIAEVGTDRDGNRPERTTYTLTPDGAAAATRWVRTQLPRIDRKLEFRVALSEAHDLPRAEVSDLLAQRRDALRAERETALAALDEAVQRGVPLQFLIEHEREAALMDADLAWLDRALAQLADSDIPWGVAEIDPQTARALRTYREGVVR